MMATETEVERTMSIVKLLSDGMILSLPNGREIAMGEDMSIGYYLRGKGIMSFSTLGLNDLNSICNEFNVGFPVPALRDHGR